MRIPNQDLKVIGCGTIQHRLRDFGTHTPSNYIGQDEYFAARPVRFEVDQGWIKLTLDDEVAKPDSQAVIVHPADPKTVRTDSDYFRAITGRTWSKRPTAEWAAMARRQHADLSYCHCVEYEGRQWRLVGVYAPYAPGIYPIPQNTIHTVLLPLKDKPCLTTT